MLDLGLLAGPVERMPAVDAWLVALGPVGGGGSIGLLVHRLVVSELDAVVGQHRVDRVGHGCDQIVKKVRRDPLSGPVVQLNDGKLACAVDGHEQVQLAVSHRQHGWQSCGIVLYPAENMKSRRFHALPLPPLAKAVVERAQAAAQTMKRADSEWLFPSVRKASKTRARCDMGATERAVSQLLRRLRGEDDADLAVAAPNLLRDLPHFTPHNIRHSLATRLGDSLAAGGSVSAVFDHSVATPGEKEFQRSSMLDVYDESHQLPLKAQASSPWCFGVYDRCEKALIQLMANDPAFADAKRGCFSRK